MFSEPVYDEVPPVLLDSLLDNNFLTLKRVPAILVFSKTNGFRHREGIEGAKTMFESLAEEHDWLMYYTENGAVFSAKNLQLFDVVIWSNTTGPALTEDQSLAFRAYLEGGGGFVAIHSAGDASHSSWSWYQDEVIRAKFTGHSLLPQVQLAKVTIEASSHPAMAHFPVEWEHEDEWYCFEQSPRARVDVLATIDEEGMTMLSIDMRDGAKIRDLSMGDDHPVIWSHTVGEGRVFYSALGHYASTYEKPEIRTMLEQAVIWVGRLSENN